MLNSIGWIVLDSWLWQLIKWMTPVFLLGLGTGWFIWAKTKQKRYLIKKQTQTEESVEALQAELERLRMKNAY